jgi:transcriptional regulator with XRE-family HTH domain
MVLLRQMLGDALRRLRLRQGRTLREVSAAARVSLGYLSEVERGQKEASSELLASICGALGAPLSQVLREVSDSFALAELQNEPAFGVPIEPALPVPSRSEQANGQQPVPAGPAASHRIPAPSRMSQPAKQRLVMPGAPRKLTVRSTQQLVPSDQLEPVSLQGEGPEFDTLTREITNMVPV